MYVLKLLERSRGISDAEVIPLDVKYNTINVTSV